MLPKNGSDMLGVIFLESTHTEEEKLKQCENPGGHFKILLTK